VRRLAVLGALLGGTALVVALSGPSTAAGDPASMAELAESVRGLQQTVVAARGLESKPLRPVVTGLGVGLGLGLCTGAAGAYVRRVRG
jgi:hypothetical protein